MKKKIWAASVGALFALLPGSAFAHVTVQPNQYEVGSFARFVVRVPNERDDASTTKVSVKFPENLVFVSFQPAPGWERTIKMKKLDEPIEVFGEEVNEVVGSVTWSGGKIGPGEFDEFGFSAKVPDEEAKLVFPAVQTYSSGEVVRWIGPEDADEPAPTVQVLDAGTAEAGGELGLLGKLHEDLHALEAEVDELKTDQAVSGQTSGAENGDEAEDDDGDDALTYVAIGLGAIALVVALASLLKKRS